MGGDTNSAAIEDADTDNSDIPEGTDEASDSAGDDDQE